MGAKSEDWRLMIAWVDPPDHSHPSTGPQIHLRKHKYPYSPIYKPKVSFHFINEITYPNYKISKRTPSPISYRQGLSFLT